MMSTPRLHRTERRRAILEAVLPVFARKGFHGVRTKQLAAAAGISEALLYRHFPSKEDLYAAILEHVHRTHGHQGDQDEFRRLAPSSRKLVWGVLRFSEHMSTRGTANDLVLPRLMTHSLLEDGAFARAMLRVFQRDLLDGLAEALDAARDAGDVSDTEPGVRPQVWLLHHLLFGMRLLSLPPRDVVAYQVPREMRARWIARFALRGLGVREEVIDREFAALERLQR